MKIEKLELYNIKLTVKDDEFITEISDKETVPLVITNKALKYGHSNGIIDSSLVSDLVLLSEDMGLLQDMKILQTIYLGYIGGQMMLGKSNYYTLEEFTNKFNIDTAEQVQLYQKLMIRDDNNFIKDIEKNTKLTLDGDKKKVSL